MIPTLLRNLFCAFLILFTMQTCSLRDIVPGNRVPKNINDLDINEGVINFTHDGKKRSVKVLAFLTDENNGNLFGNGVVFGSWNPIRSIIVEELYGVIGFFYVNPRENEDGTELYQTNLTDLTEGRYSFSINEEYGPELSINPLFAFCLGENACTNDEEYNEYEFEEGFFEIEKKNSDMITGKFEMKNNTISADGFFKVSLE